MIIVTGGCGLIGSNIIRSLNARGLNEILVVDNLENGEKITNISSLHISDYIDKEDFLDRIDSLSISNIQAVFHLGACSSTTEWNGKYIMKNNYEYSKVLYHYAQANNAQFIYASSASVYGLGRNGYAEDISSENPLNMYAYSKHLFDQYIRKHIPKSTSQVVGLRYFNVYGPGEHHKGTMASTIYHFNNQILAAGQVNVFEGHDGYENGGHQRDFVYVKDCAAVNLWFLEHPDISGIFNLGTGQSRCFNDVANAVISWHANKSRHGKINYIPFPKHLKRFYQSYTRADLSRLRNAGVDHKFHTLEEGISDYLDCLN